MCICDRTLSATNASNESEQGNECSVNVLKSDYKVTLCCFSCKCIANSILFHFEYLSRSVRSVQLVSAARATIQFLLISWHLEPFESHKIFIVFSFSFSLSSGVECNQSIVDLVIYIFFMIYFRQFIIANVDYGQTSFVCAPNEHKKKTKNHADK